jgi:hypothetical protein
MSIASHSSSSEVPAMPARQNEPVARAKGA